MIAGYEFRISCCILSVSGVYGQIAGSGYPILVPDEMGVTQQD